MTKKYKPVRNPAKKPAKIEVPVNVRPDQELSLRLALTNIGNDVQRPEQRQVYVINLGLTIQFLSAARERAQLTDRELYLELQGDMILSGAGYDINGQPKYQRGRK